MLYHRIKHEPESGRGIDLIVAAMRKFRAPPSADAGEKEIIICAAVLYENGRVWVGNAHCDCFLVARGPHRGALNEGAREKCQGFVTSRRRFVDRIEGLAIAEAAGQVVGKHSPKDELLSEDLADIPGPDRVDPRCRMTEAE